jgi:Ran GTPase-activating protein (RanGAP) involved in mRNA processing and transport
LLLGVNRLEDQGVAALAEGLRANRTLVELGLASNGLTGEGVARLASAVCEHPTLQVLDLGYGRSTRALSARANLIGPDGAAAIAAMLAANSRLVRLDLRGTGISARDVDRIAEQVEHNTTLSKLLWDFPIKPPLEEWLARNAALSPEFTSPTIRDVALIRSVYRTI